MAAEGEVEMRQLLVIKGVNCFVIEGTQRKLLGVTDLQVLALGEDSLLLYSADCFHYAIKKGILSLKASSHSFVFPGSEHQCFGIVLPATIPPADLEMFIALLSDYSDYSVQVDDDSVATDTAGSAAAAGGAGAVVVAAGAGAVAASSSDEDKVAKYGMKAADLLKKGTALAQVGIAKGTVVAAAGIRKARDYAKKKITKREEVEVSETTRQRIKTAKSAASGAVKISRAIVVGARSMMSEMSSAVATAAAETEYGKKVKDADSERAVAAKEVTKAVLIGGLTILDDLLNAAVVLVGEVADSSADVAGYKYGDQVAESAADAAAITKSGAEVAKSIKEVTPTMMAVRTVADATVEGLSTEEEAKALKAKREEADPEAKALAFMAKTTAAAAIASSES